MSALAFYINPYLSASTTKAKINKYKILILVGIGRYIFSTAKLAGDIGTVLMTNERRKNGSKTILHGACRQNSYGRIGQAGRTG